MLQIYLYLLSVICLFGYSAKMKVLLINPPWYRFFGCSYQTVPLGLAYIGGILKQNGIDAGIYNADFQMGAKPVSAYLLTANHENYVKRLEDDSSPIWQELADTVRDFKPDVVGITATSATLPSAFRVARICKQSNETILTILGGPHATLAPKSVLSEKAVDVAVSNEGENTFLEIVSLFERGMPFDRCAGISYRKDRRVVTNPQRKFIQDLDSLPFPAKDFVIGKEKYPPSAFSEIIASRGCPFECSYCASPIIWGRSVRRRSVENVIAELEWTAKMFGVQLFEFRDDVFTLDRRWAMDFCDAVRRSKKGFRWGCITRADFLDAELVRKMKQSGCEVVSIGLESSSFKTLQKLGKKMAPKTVFNAAKLLRDAELPFHLYVMVGFPWETEEDMRDTIITAKNLQPTSIVFSIATPHPNTRLSRQMKPKVKEGRWGGFFHQNPLFPPRGMSRKEFYGIILSLERDVDAYNYLNYPLPLKQRLRSIFKSILKGYL